jgi:aldehyde dehydrogenase (NAD+)
MELQEIGQIIENQRTYFKSNATLPIQARIKALRALKASIQKYEPQIYEALYADLGKEKGEAYMAEVGMTYAEISYMLSHVKSLASTKKVPTPLFEFGSKSEVVSIPYGTVLIMSPWNYPFMLAMMPLVDAVAAGNTVCLKPSAYSPATSAILAKILIETFDPAYVSVILGGRQENQALLEAHFDYIFFTGSVLVGKEVMAKASKYLTPVTLELGGKSPCIVDESANLALAAKRIVFGKFLNAGQTCVAPDYILVHESVHDALIKQLIHQIKLQYPNMVSIGKIINEKHYQRLCGLIDETKIVYGGICDAKTRQISPTLLDNAGWDDACMQEEIFGPILPIITYSSFEELMKLLRSKPTPLACYLFSRDEYHIGYIKKALPFGSGCINDCILQLANDHLPFGGMGNSGMGEYHGKYGFETFTHQKGMLINDMPVDIPLRYRQFCDKALSVIRLFLH